MSTDFVEGQCSRFNHADGVRPAVGPEVGAEVGAQYIELLLVFDDGPSKQP